MDCEPGPCYLLTAVIVEQFSLRPGDRDDETTLYAFGDVDIVSRDAFTEALVALVDRNRERAVVDLSDVTFMDSSGIHALLVARGHAENAGRTLVVRPSAPVRRVLSVTGLLDVLNVDG
jgi:anti-sigma B factor antagonist